MVMTFEEPVAPCIAALATSENVRVNGLMQPCIVKCFE